MKTAQDVRNKQMNFRLAFLIFEDHIPLEEYYNFTIEELLDIVGIAKNRHKIKQIIKIKQHDTR